MPASRARVTRNKLRPDILALVAIYYPAGLKDLILNCCNRQLRGDYRRSCRHPLCPACCSVESYKIAKRQLERLQACTPPGKRVRLAHEVYTLPPHLRPLVRSRPGFKAWAEATRQTIREIHGADVAGVMNLHPIGDEDLLEFHPHWDVVVNGYLLTESGAVREHRPPWIDYDDARAIYSRNLTRHLKLRPDQEPRVVSIYLDRARGIFHTAPRKTWHIVRYSARHVYQPNQAWLNERGNGGDWWYRPHKDAASVRAYEGKDVIRSLLDVQVFLRAHRHRVWFGYMQNRLQKASAAKFAAWRTSD